MNLPTTEGATVETVEVWKMLAGSPYLAIVVWLLLQARGDVKEERVRNQTLVDTIIKISGDRVADANGRTFKP